MKTLFLPANAPGTAETAAKILQEGGLVAVPTETVYGLGANGLEPEAVKKIFEAIYRRSAVAHWEHRAQP